MDTKNGFLGFIVSFEASCRRARKAFVVNT